MGARMNMLTRWPAIGGSGGGGKGGQGSGSGFTEAPNTLESTAIARFVDLLCEGEIGGLVNGQKSIIFNKVAVQNADDSLNFQGFSYSFLPGTESQGALPGFGQITNEFGIGTEVRNDSPVTYATQGANLDAVVCTLQIPSLVQQDTTNGGMNGYNVAIAIDLKMLPSGGWFTAVAGDYISGKCTSPYERSYRIALPVKGANYLIRMRRLSEDTDNTVTIQNKTIFSHITEIVDHQIAYSDSAVAGIVIDAKQFGTSVPSREYDIYGKKIQYPSNYDPVARTYTGFWDGSWSYGYCNNPAWVMRDIAINPRYGVNIDEAYIDKWGLYELSQFNDELVPDGMGGQEPRFVFNGVLQDQVDAYSALQMIASMMRAIIFYGAGSVLISQDAPKTPMRLFTMANIVGDFSYSGTSKSARHTACVVQWTNPLLGYDTDYMVYEDPDQIAKYGYNALTIRAIGTTSPGQALRQAKWAVLTEKYQYDTVTFKCGIEGAQCLPGDLIEVADPHFATADFGGRITKVVDTHNVQLDRAIQFTGATTPQIHLTILTGAYDDVPNMDNSTRPDRRIITYFSSTVTSFNPANNQVTFADALPAGALVDGVPVIWIFSCDQIAPRPFQILGRKDNDDGTFSITAVNWSEQKFADLDENYVLSDYHPAYGDLPSTSFCQPPQAPFIANVITKEVSGAGVVPCIDLSWGASTDQFLRGYQVAYKQGDDNYTVLPLTPNNSAEIVNPPTGTYFITVKAINAFGNSSAQLTVSVDIQNTVASSHDLVLDILSENGDSFFTGTDCRVVWSSLALSAIPATSNIKSVINRISSSITKGINTYTIGSTTYAATDGTHNYSGSFPLAAASCGVSVAVPTAPTFTVGGAFVPGDQIVITIGLSQITVDVGYTHDNNTIASQIAAAIDADARYTATAAGAVVTMHFASGASNATNLEGHDDPYFDHYLVQVKTPAGVLLRAEQVTEANYTYTLENNYFDNSAVPIRSIRFDIAVVDIFGTTSNFATNTLSNPSPDDPGVTVVPLVQGVLFQFVPPTDPDYQGIIIYMSPSNGFVPGPTNKMYQGPGNPRIDLPPGVTYYYKYGFYDTFGIAGITLSAQGSVTALGVDGTMFDTTAPGVPVFAGTPLVSTSSIDAVTGLPVINLTAQWIANSDTDLEGYELAIKEGSGNFIEGFTVGAATSFTWTNLKSNVSYQVKIRAVDKTGNRSAYNAPATLTTAKDTTAPAAPTGVVGNASVNMAFLSWTNPSDADLDRIEVWEMTANTTPNRTTDIAKRIAVVNAVPGQVGGFSRSGLTSGVPLYYFLAAVDTSGNFSAFSTSSGAVTATAPSSVPPNGSITLNMFSAGLTGIQVVGTLPVVTTANNGQVAYLSTDGKVYRVVGGVWVKTTDGADIIAGSVTANAIAAGTITGDRIAANTLSSGNLVVSARQVQWNGIKLAANCSNVASQTAAANNVAWSAGSITYLDNSNVAQTQNISAGSAVWSTGVLYIYYTPGLAVFSTTTTASVAMADGVILIGSYAGGTSLVMSGGATLIDGSNIFTGTITATQMAAHTITATQIAAGTITATEIQAGSITGDRFNTATSLPGTITVGVTGVSIGTIQTQAADPITVANGKSTQLLPGLVTISGATTLANWRNGTDATKIEGGSIAANTIVANSIQIGARGVTTQGLNFSVDRATNIVSWGSGNGGGVSGNAGKILYVDDTGTPTSATITHGSATLGAGGLIYWTKGGTILQTTTTLGTALTANNLLMATYDTVSGLTVLTGGTIIDGTNIKTATITATQIAAATIQGSNIAGTTITGANIAGATITGGNIAGNTITGDKIVAGSITANLLQIIGDPGNAILDSQTTDTTYWSAWPATTSVPVLSPGHGTGSGWLSQTIMSFGVTATVTGGIQSQPFKVQAGQVYVYSAQCSAALSTRVMLYAVWFDGSGTNFQNDAISDQTIAGQSMYTGRVTAPANAVFGRLLVYCPTPANTTTVFFAAPSVTKGLTTLAIPDGLITGTQIAGSTITTGNIAANTIVGGNIHADTIVTNHLQVGTVTGQTTYSSGTTGYTVQDTYFGDGTTWNLMGSLSMTAPFSGSLCLLAVSFDLHPSDSSQFAYIRLLRDGGDILPGGSSGQPVNAQGSGDSSGRIGFIGFGDRFNFTFLDFPGAGGHSYAFYISLQEYAFSRGSCYSAFFNLGATVWQR